MSEALTNYVYKSSPMDVLLRALMKNYRPTNQHTDMRREATLAIKKIIRPIKIKEIEN